MAVLQYLKACNLLAGLTEGQLDLFQRLSERRAASKGTVIFSAGEPATHLYVVGDGRVAVDMALSRRSRAPSRVTTMATLEPGEAFGWSALVGPYAYTLSATALEPCALVRIEAGGMREVLRGDDRVGSLIMANLAKLLAGRLAITQQKLIQEQHGVISVPRARRKGKQP